PPATSRPARAPGAPGLSLDPVSTPGFRCSGRCLVARIHGSPVSVRSLAGALHGSVCSPVQVAAASRRPNAAAPSPFRLSSDICARFTAPLFVPQYSALEMFICRDPDASSCVSAHISLKSLYNLCAFFFSALGDIKIAEVNVKGLFVRLINSSLDKELEIGGHILQQNVNGQTVSFYRFLPHIIMQANCTVTVWAAASEAKHQPPSDFLWREQSKFGTSPNCTTILCKPNGEAVAWYTPIHWKQAWEKLETDIEFDRCSVVSSASRRHMFNWPATITTTKEKQDKCNKDISKYQMEQVRGFLKREKENPPNPFPNSSPWCHSPSVPAHPYSPLIETCTTCMARSSLNRQPRPQSSRPDPAQKKFTGAWHAVLARLPLLWQGTH
uniref:LTD domain-containing protein n=1 Tax=Ursus americanus TaxID=9643 RepID=A0A452REX8_URSAM